MGRSPGRVQVKPGQRSSDIRGEGNTGEGRRRLLKLPTEEKSQNGDILKFEKKSPKIHTICYRHKPRCTVVCVCRARWGDHGSAENSSITSKHTNIKVHPISRKTNLIILGRNMEVTCLKQLTFNYTK